MSRPIKDTVDYFPHDCKHRKTMFIIEQKYGNDGYAFWFKMLESLGETKGHFIDCNNDAEWEFLQSKTRQNNGFCAEILNLLAKLAAIDKDLWTKHRVIWCQNFVDRVAEVYNKRQRDIPQKPVLDNDNPSVSDVSVPETMSKQPKLGDKTDKVN